MCTVMMCSVHLGPSPLSPSSVVFSIVAASIQVSATAFFNEIRQCVLVDGFSFSSFFLSLCFFDSTLAGSCRAGKRSRLDQLVEW